MELKIENLSRSYRSKRALNGVNLALSGGDTCLLLGPNGSGKTTMMKIIAGLVAPSSGNVLVNGEELKTAHKNQIAYMPTENFFYNYMNVQDAGRYYADFFSDFSLDGFKNAVMRAELDLKAPVRTLSSGMAAKLRLCLTLNRNAPIMMFDEPINGVDMLTRDWVLSEIAAMRNEQRIMLISTHLVEEAAHLANCIACLKNGNLVSAGRMDELCREMSLEDLYRSIYGSHTEGEVQ